MRDFHVGAVFGGRQFPAHDGSPSFVVVPVRDPGVGQQTRRIEFQHFSFAKELAHAIDVQLALLGSEAPFAARTRIHFKELGLTFLAVPPEHQLLWIGDRLKYLARAGALI